MLPASNLLDAEASPYLRQHSDNPVHWRAWSAASLDEAKTLGRPILLSVGYAACHWCHVMAHESFENDEVAAVMNRLFVNIKVDREERPDIDQIYMAALAGMGQQGGWPLTMFLTPDARPFWGGTYFPREPRYGRQSFIQVLEAVDQAWRERPASVLQNASALSDHVGKTLAGTHPPAKVSRNGLKSLADGIAALIDHDAGGLRGAPKFPNAPFMQTLWLSWLQNGVETHRVAVIETLEHMLAGGIYDHIGGGLSRYSTDAVWLVPHFEKMLYDNAQLIRLCNWAFADSGNELFRKRIEETVDWLLREMRPENGAFAASLDADSDGEEGLFYTWREEDIEAVLGEDSALFFNCFTLSKPDGWEGDPILHQTLAQGRNAIARQSSLAGLQAKLLAARKSRVSPGRDDKILVDWNGLMITALAEAGRHMHRPDWIGAAAAAFNQIIAAAQPDGRLAHSILGPKRLYPALSSDYAAMTSAAIALFEATQDASYIDHGRNFLHQLDLWHQDADKTGYFLTASDSSDVPLRIRGDVDEAIPSATSQIIEAMVRMASLAGDLELQERTWIVAQHAAGRIESQRFGQAGIVSACALALEPHKLIVVEDPATPMLVSAANRNPDPRRVDVIVPLGHQGGHANLAGDQFVDTTKAGAYLCAGLVCLPVINDAEILEEALRRR